MGGAQRGPFPPRWDPVSVPIISNAAVVIRVLGQTPVLPGKDPEVLRDAGGTPWPQTLICQLTAALWGPALTSHTHVTKVRAVRSTPRPCVTSPASRWLQKQVGANDTLLFQKPTPCVDQISAIVVCGALRSSTGCGVHTCRYPCL